MMMKCALAFALVFLFVIVKGYPMTHDAMAGAIRWSVREQGATEGVVGLS